MSNEALAKFANQQYLNLESYKRNGTPIQTPVWFAEDGGVLYLHAGECQEGQAYTPESTGAYRPLYDAWQRYRSVGGG